MNNLNTVIIGLGNIGCKYDYNIPFIFNDPKSSKYILTHARAVACHPNFSFLCGIDSNLVACELFKKKYKTQAFSNISEWSNSKEFRNPDLAIIAIPPNQQLATLKNLLNECVPKILLLEKPLATNNRDLKELKNICNEYQNMTVLVNYIRSFLPAIDKVQKIIQTGKLGKFVYGNLVYGKGLLNNASHFINLAELLIGDLNLQKKYKSLNKCLDYDEEINLVLKSSNYNSAELNVVSISKVGMVAGELDLWFENGRILWPNNGSNINIWFSEKMNSDKNMYYKLERNPKKIFTDMNRYQIHVLNNLFELSNKKSKTIPLCSLNSGAKTLELLLSK